MAKNRRLSLIVGWREALNCSKVKQGVNTKHSLEALPGQISFLLLTEMTTTSSFAFFQVYTIGIKPRLANKAVLAAHFFFMILFKVIGYSGHISSGMVFCENSPRNADCGDHVFNFAKDFGPGCRVCK